MVTQGQREVGGDRCRRRKLNCIALSSHYLCAETRFVVARNTVIVHVATDRLNGEAFGQSTSTQ